MSVPRQPFEELITEHGPVVMRVCRAMLGPADADDAWSETFIAALRAYPDLRPHSNVRGWLVTIAHNKAIDILRRAARAPRPIADVAQRPNTESTERLDAPVDDDLRTALDRLPPKQRGAVVYRYLADMAYADVAALLDSSEAAARRSAADGIAALRTVLHRPDPKGQRP